MPDLAQRHTVLIPDLRGTGDSDRPDGGFAKTNQADDIRGHPHRPEPHRPHGRRRDLPASRRLGRARSSPRSVSR
ncbi:alpha/beta fold hydrolase [Streptomyces sp. NPDC056637]